MRNYYSNDNGLTDITAAMSLREGEAALDAVLSRIERVMNDLGDIPFAGYYCD